MPIAISAYRHLPEPASLVTVRTCDSLSALESEDWNRLNHTDNPFLRREFLYALESCGCLREEYGWVANYFLAYDANNQLIAAVPAYIKFNSHGEFVFDWSWADVHRQLGLAYYPKLVIGVPYTPVTGARFLIDPQVDYRSTVKRLLEAVVDFCQTHHYSSIHWLFNLAAEADLLESHGWLRRLNYQYHWHNHNYTDFEDFLQSLRSKKRKQIKRERRLVAEAEIEMQVLRGDELDEATLRLVHSCYAETFEKKQNLPVLTAEFFQTLAGAMGDAMVVVLAKKKHVPIAAALFFRSSDTLYGRYWGSFEHYNGLHFEACFYQGIEYAIGEGLTAFEPGAQGEHKIWRGFLPVPTHSCHWISHPQLQALIERHLVQERAHMQDWHRQLMQLSPYSRC